MLATLLALTLGFGTLALVQRNRADAQGRRATSMYLLAGADGRIDITEDIALKIDHMRTETSRATEAVGDSARVDTTRTETVTAADTVSPALSVTAEVGVIAGPVAQLVYSRQPANGFVRSAFEVAVVLGVEKVTDRLDGVFKKLSLLADTRPRGVSSPAPWISQP